MNKQKVLSANQALAYITDCTLATVASLCMKKSSSKYETQRQISIAQTAIDWMVSFDVDFSETRAHDVVKKFDGKVSLWADKYRE